MKDPGQNHSTPAHNENSSSRETDWTAAPSQFLTRWNAEILSLYGKRMQEYCMMPFSLMLCTSADDFTDLQDKFCATLQADYAATVGKLALVVSDADEGNNATESYASTLLKAQEDARSIIEQARAQAERIIADAESQTRDRAAELRASAAA